MSAKPKLGPAAVKHGDLKLSAGWVMVTPKIAEQFLSRSDNPRKLKQDRVDVIAEDLLLDSWEPNGETIKLDADGLLRDGQHRCAAIVESGKPALCLVVYGVSERGVERTDEGRPRTYGDVLRARGEKNVAQLGSCVAKLRRLLLYHATEAYRSIQSKGRPGNRALDRVLELHPDIRGASGRIDRAYQAKMGTRAVLAVCYYAFSLVDEQLAGDLIDAVAKGENLAAGDPVLAYRARLIAVRTSQMQLGAIEGQALLIKCWNAWRTQQPTKMTWIRFGKDPEPFPLVDGLVQALASRDR